MSDRKLSCAFPGGGFSALEIGKNPVILSFADQVLAIFRRVHRSCVWLGRTLRAEYVGAFASVVPLCGLSFAKGGFGLCLLAGDQHFAQHVDVASQNRQRQISLKAQFAVIATTC